MKADGISLPFTFLSLPFSSLPSCSLHTQHVEWVYATRQATIRSCISALAKCNACPTSCTSASTARANDDRRVRKDMSKHANSKRSTILNYAPVTNGFPLRSPSSHCIPGYLLCACLALARVALRARTTGVGFLVHCWAISTHASPIAARAETFSILSTLLVTEHNSALVDVDL